MIWDTLEATGVDPNFIQVVKLFYTNNKQILKLRARCLTALGLGGSATRLPPIGVDICHVRGYTGENIKASET